MSTHGKKVRLEPALEYAAFSGINIIFSPVEKPEDKWIGKIDLVSDDHFTLSNLKIQRGSEILSIEWDFLKKTINDYSEFQIGFGYKRQFLTFKAQVKPNEDNRSTCAIAKIQYPQFATLTNQRTLPRYFLNNRNDFRIYLRIQNKRKTSEIYSAIIHNISHSYIAVICERSQGLILPDDQVEFIEIKIGEELIFEAKGIVTKVTQAVNSPKTSIVVIAFGELTESGILKNKDKSNTNETLVEKRKHQRISLLNDTNCYIRIQNPLSTEETIYTASICDVSSTGIAVLIEQSRVPFPIGLKLSKFQIYLSKAAAVTACGEVMHSQYSVDEHGYSYRIGLKFNQPSMALLRLIAGIQQNRIHQSLFDASADDYEQMWELFFEAGFIYRQKRENIQTFSKKIFDTYFSLMTKDPPFVRKVLFKENGHIKGHISAVKIFDHTWLGQHLTAMKAKNAPSAAQELLRAITQFFRIISAHASTESSYITFYYRPNSIFPTIVYGEAMEQINNKKLCNYIEYQYCLPTLTERAPLEGDQFIRTGHTSEDDLYQLEALLLEQNQHTLMRLEGLHVESFSHLEISKQYEHIGLYRKRIVLVASNELDGRKAYAICNLTSPGVNLSELTNSFRIFYSHPTDSSNQALANHLGKAILETYSHSAMTKCVLLKPENDPLPEQFQMGKSYRYWYMDLQETTRFQIALERVFLEFKQLLRKYYKDGNAKAA